MRALQSASLQVWTMRALETERQVMQLKMCQTSEQTALSTSIANVPAPNSTSIPKSTSCPVHANPAHRTYKASRDSENEERNRYTPTEQASDSEMYYDTETMFCALDENPQVTPYTSNSCLPVKNLQKKKTSTSSHVSRFSSAVDLPSSDDVPNQSKRFNPFNECPQVVVSSSLTESGHYEYQVRRDDPHLVSVVESKKGPLKGVSSGSNAAVSPARPQPARPEASRTTEKNRSQNARVSPVELLVDLDESSSNTNTPETRNSGSKSEFRELDLQLATPFDVLHAFYARTFKHSRFASTASTSQTPPHYY